MTKPIKFIFGITAIGLLVTLAAIASLTTIAAPSYTALIYNGRLTTQLNLLQTAANLARSEAIKRNSYITLCRIGMSLDKCLGKGDWSKGWIVFIDNNVDGSVDIGDRVLLKQGPFSNNNKIVFNRIRITYSGLPSNDPCTFGGSGWLMELDLYSGAGLAYTPFDLNGDGVFDDKDYIHVDLNGDGIVDAGELFAPASGKKSQVGIISTPSVVNSQDAQKEYKYTSGSSGAIEVTVENPGPNFSGRQSWRQLDFTE